MSDEGHATLIALAALALAVDESGAVSRKVALLVRLASTTADIGDCERKKLDSCRACSKASGRTD